MNEDQALIDAISEGRAWEVSKTLASSGDSTANEVVQVCEVIFSATNKEAERLGGISSNLNVTIEADGSGQLHLINATAATREDAQQFVARAQSDGYVGWQDFDGGARQSFFRHERQATLVRLDGVAYTLVVRWEPSHRAARLPSVLRPSAADHRFVDLPAFAWPAYIALRPVRLAVERVRGTGVPKALGPILSTPESLLAPLLDFANVTQSDHLFDLGCGEGRVVIAAAEGRGCRATGVEHDPRLVTMAKRRLAASSANADLVTIIEGDAASVSLADATVVFLFIPAEAIDDAVGHLADIKGRVISHEQRFIAGVNKPLESRILVGADALTVAHLW